MKKIFFILIITSLISCSQKKPETSNLEKIKTSENQSLEVKKKNNAFDKLNNGHTLGNYKGKIGTYLNIKFHLENENGNVSGFYFYEKFGVDINVIGTIKENKLTLYELNYKNDTIAIIKGTIDKYGIYGKWINYKNKIEHPLTLEKKEIEITRIPNNIIGEYHNDVCNLTLSFSKLKGEYYYNYKSTERNLKGKVVFSREDDLYITLSEIEFAEDYFDISLPEEDLEKEKEYEELKRIGERYIGVDCYYSPEELIIQNYGNAMSYYVKLSDCGEKYIHFKRQ